MSAPMSVTVTLTSRQWAAIIARLYSLPTGDTQKLDRAKNSLTRQVRKAMSNDK